MNGPPAVELREDSVQALVNTGKAMAGLIDDARHGRLGARDQVGFIHTGGCAARLSTGDTHWEAQRRQMVEQSFRSVPPGECSGFGSSREGRVARGSHVSCSQSVSYPCGIPARDTNSINASVRPLARCLASGLGILQPRKPPPRPAARAPSPYFSVLRNSSKLCGSTSGTTCTCVVNLYGAFASPLSNTSSTKNAVQPDSGLATRPT